MEKTALEFIARFDQLTGVQKRNFIERMISRVVIKKDNRLELHVLWDASSSARRKSYVGDPSTTSSLRSDSARDDGEKLENDEKLINSVYYKGQKKVVTRTTISATSSSRERGGGTVVEFKKEEKVVKAVKQMREQGLSLRQIAKNLSAMGIPTKCYGMKWHPEMVRRVLT